MPSVLTRPGAALPFELRVMTSETGTVQHAFMTCCDCPTHVGHFPWSRPLNPTSIVEKFERMGWEVYKNKARCPDCKRARARQKSHFAEKDRLHRLQKKEEEMQTQTHQTPRVSQSHQTNQNVTQMKPPSNPSHPQGPVHIDAPEVVRTYIMTVYNDGSVEMRDVEGAKEMLFGDQTYLVIPR